MSAFAGCREGKGGERRGRKGREGEGSRGNLIYSYLRLSINDRSLRDDFVIINCKCDLGFEQINRFFAK